MKIELNLPALERLIGGDTELELNLRKKIVQEFARRHLKEVADQATYAVAVDETRQYVNSIAKEYFDVESLASAHLWPMIGNRLKSMIEKLVQGHAQTAVDAALLRIIEYQKRYWGDEIKKAVKKEMDRQIEKEIADGIQQRLDAARNAGSK